MGIRAANRAYERWLAHELRGDMVEADLDEKHEKMRDSAFAFLRATYWRWAETSSKCAPISPTRRRCWRSATSIWKISAPGATRKAASIWGVNDYDEAAEMPYILDLVRLAASAALATTPAAARRSRRFAANTPAGYEHGLEAPEAFVLDRQHMWLRTRFVVGEAERADVLAEDRQPVSRRAGEKESRAAAGALAQVVSPARCRSRRSALAYWRRTAGTGSLGRPRWLGYGTWRGGPLLRECKALVPSGWTRAHGDGAAAAPQRYRAAAAIARPIPWYRRERQSAGAAAVAEQPQDQRRRTGATPPACCIPICSGPWAATSPPSISACATAATRCARTSRSANSAGSARCVEAAAEFVSARIRSVEEIREIAIRSADLPIMGPIDEPRRQTPHVPRAAPKRLLRHSQSVECRQRALSARPRLQGAGHHQFGLCPCAGLCRRRR